MKNKGITLVALVITIIILLILAGISISALTNQGLFKQAQNAKNLTEEKTAEENEILTNYLEQMNAIIGGQVTEIDGAVVTPINDITTWLKTAGISEQYSYTTIEQVIVDSTCIQSLMKNENAMKYLARSTEFADAICASETTMTYLGQSAYVDDTVLNSDSWKQSIKASQYWPLVYTTVYTIHAGALETISIDGVYGSFTTNADGTVNHALPLGDLTLYGSVSKQSFTRTVTKDTTDVYVMPDGLVIYWCGNDNTGGYEKAYQSKGSNGACAIGSSGIYVKGGTANASAGCGMIFKDKLALSQYKYLNFNITQAKLSGSVGGNYLIGALYFAKEYISGDISNYQKAYSGSYSVTPSDWYNNANPKTVKVDMSEANMSDGYIILLGYAYNGEMYIDKVWLSNE